MGSLASAVMEKDHNSAELIRSEIDLLIMKDMKQMLAQQRSDSKKAVLSIVKSRCSLVLVAGAAIASFDIYKSVTDYLEDRNRCSLLVSSYRRTRKREIQVNPISNTAGNSRFWWRIATSRAKPLSVLEAFGLTRRSTRTLDHSLPALSFLSVAVKCRLSLRSANLK